ncbi:energy-coupling factor ABC transporter permease [Sphaerisporangium corydalis]|uniref:Energy-coupling factor ABC transporter permease n=1 Tax=Sphaerisporangium corydalis TaxID=1441875 RepID=A0ABV9ELR1_9ACTN|nr:energy-coupling factor ABC transporter permease [Sphaerisporangium corydalis]
MHVPDGFFNAPVSVAAGAFAATGLGVCLRGARRELDDRTAPMAGLVAAFIFAVQMLNFPVAAGTSGHLLGGTLAAVLVGPYTAVLCVSVVLLVQGFFFADGGLTALGVNITLMAIVTTVVGWTVFRLIVRAAPRGRSVVPIAAFFGAAVSVPVASLAFTALFWIGGTAPIDVSSVAVTMGGVHVLIGLGEGLITALTVSSVLAVRPDLVYGARGLTAPLLLRTPGGTTEVATGPAPRPHRSARPLLAGGALVAVVLAGVVSFYASSSPDGLEKVAADKGLNTHEASHPLGESPLAGYGVKGVGSERLAVGLAGVAGVGITVLAGGAIFYAVRRRGRSADEAHA